MIKVAGVMFRNDAMDGGRNRQDILKELYDKNKKEFVVDVEYRERKDDTFGMKLREHDSQEVIGWVHTETANAIIASGKRPEKYIGYLDYHGHYHVKLDDIKPKEIVTMVDSSPSYPYFSYR